MKKIELVDSKSRLIFFIAIAIGSVGAIGQAFMLRHELVDCYPYKMMSFPPSDFYKSIGNFGVFIAPVVATGGGLLFGRLKFWLASIIPVVLCPILFSIVYKLAFFIRQSNGISDIGRNFDGTLPEIVARNFFIYSLEVSLVGLIIGASCGFLLSRLFKVEKFA